jgi:BirA family biotin operon repressor/biotin-[acetyl-CoA-carboxylase] ligase
MDFPLSRQIAPGLTFVTETGSTNADLVANYANTDDFTVLVAGFQSAGRGRAGRDWLAPAGSSLFVSVLLKPGGVPAERFSWLPLLSGLAMANAVTRFLPDKEVSLKWPNDVLVGDQKISGVLSELLPDISGVVVGAGLNVLQAKSELPIETATSISIESGQSIELDQILAAYLEQLKEHYVAWVSSLGDADLSGLRTKVLAACSSLGTTKGSRFGNSRVRVILPGDQEVLGNALGIDETGRLLVQAEGGKELIAVAAGDIVHLRHN